ncbi:hypothetical protein ACFS6H_04750 [Terrimonas rubra]|uniref:Uncharacterized protein n=1 Tax=Terrimonas rubra TaxID=1035890 RepID=A0ABW6A3D3_9BACT
MKLFLLIICVIILGVGTAQDTTFYTAFRDAINSTGNTGTVFYIDTAIAFWHKPSELAKKKTLHGVETIRVNKKNSLALTKKELKSLDQQAKQAAPVLWPEDMMPDSRRVTRDTINSIAYQNRWRDGEKEKPVHYYYFSQPIYTRNNTLLMFYVYDMINYSAGYTFLFVYRLEKEGWKHRLAISTGAF